MRIDLNHGPQPLPESNRAKAQSAASAGSSAGKLTEGEDQAELSGAHAQVQALAAQALQLPIVRQERVHALRAAIQSGLYHPSPEVVAGAVFEHMSAGPAA